MPLSFLIDAAVGGSVMYLSEIIIFFFLQKIEVRMIREIMRIM